jgi:alkanesulfonate monooxygenase SsuD/methylene tetrahydromethanopterin reductase-like flavin-dependent oxidoreductase (luciferase family)
MTDKAIERGAELGLSFACNLGAREVALYRKAMQERGKNPADFSIVQSRLLYIAETPEQAWDDIRDAAMYQAELYGKWLSAAAGTTDQSKVLIRPDPERLRRTSVLGTAVEVRDKLNNILAATPFTELIVVTQLPGLDPQKARRSLDRFGADVLPQLR